MNTSTSDMTDFECSQIELLKFDVKYSIYLKIESVSDAYECHIFSFFINLVQTRDAKPFTFEKEIQINQQESSCLIRSYGFLSF